MNFIQSTLQALEVGKGQILTRIIPLFITVFAVAFFYNFGPFQTPFLSIGGVYHGLSDAQSMDNAQLARQIVRHQGFTTEFLRPMAVAQLRDYAASHVLLTGSSHDLFPADRFPAGTPRILPDTYNAPGYPCLLAAWFKVTHPDFEQTPMSISANRFYSPDRWIPLLNQAFMLLTALLVFTLGRRLFDERVAWLSLLSFLGTDLIWHFTLTALSTTFLMFLVTAMLMCALEIFCVSEACAESEDRSFTPAWNWGYAVALLLGAACLTRLHLLVLLVPLLMFLLAMPRASFALWSVIAVLVIGFVTPWFLHLDKVSGNPLGSNFALVLTGTGAYEGNQVYCATSIPGYENLFKNALKKETAGFRWHLENAWNLLGANPLILLFGASVLHQFKRRRTRWFHWLLFACAFAVIAANNLGDAAPEALGPWNTLVILFPGMLVIGCAFFFILLDRLNLQIKLLNSLIVIATITLTLVPMALTLTTPATSNFCLPYVPPAIKFYGQLAQPDEWVTSDMPWATAWYADRASLWLPDSITDFQNFHDNLCPTGMLFLTGLSWSEPVSTFTVGEDKDWFPFVSGTPLPALFPLPEHYALPFGSSSYYFWSDRVRWPERR
jgi:hypothetical protein